MGKKRVLVFAFLFVVSALAIVSASPISKDVHISIQTTYSNGSIQTGTFNFVFNISTNSSCNASTVLYSDSVNLTTDSNGLISYYLPNVDLPFDQQYWLCYYRGGSLIDNAQLSPSPYSFRASYVDLSGVQVDTNFNLSGYNISTDGTGFFGGLGSLLNRVKNIFAINLNLSGNFSSGGSFFVDSNTGNVNTTGNISANYLFGNAKYVTGITATATPAGTTGAVQYNNQPSGTGGNASAFWFDNTKHEVGINGSLVVNGVNWSSSHGAIIASGNNSNGYYVEYADGTMIEWESNLSLGTVSVTQGAGTTQLFYPPQPPRWTYPIPFSSTPSVQSQVSGPSGGLYWTGSDSGQIQLGTNSTSAVIEPLSGTSISGIFYAYVYAIGRWTNLNLGSGSGGSGGIVNTITNANGTCTQWANGIMECYGTVGGSITFTTSSYNANKYGVSSGNIYYFNSFNKYSFPTPFISVPVMTEAGGQGTDWIISNSEAANSITPSSFSVQWQYATTGTHSVFLQYVAIGRWTNSTSVNTPDYSTWGLNSAGNIVTVNDSRNVGIRTPSPAYPLDVSGEIYASGSSLQQIYGYTSNGNANSAGLYGYSVNGYGLQGYGNIAGLNATGTNFGVYGKGNSYGVYSNGNLGAGNSSTTNFFVNTTSGRVGIGTSSPSARLDVNGNIVAEGLLNLAPQTNPTGAVQGSVFYNSSSNTPMYYNGSKWFSMGGSVPAGAVVAFDSQNCPVGWIPANGQSGTPDLRGIFLRGAGTNGVLHMANGTAFSAAFGTYENDSFQNFLYQYLNGFGNAAAINGAQQYTASTNPYNNLVMTGTQGGSIVTAGSSYGSPRLGAETKPASYALTYCVKISQDTAVSNSIWGTSQGNVTLSNSSNNVYIPNNTYVSGNVSVSGTLKGLYKQVTCNPASTGSVDCSCGAGYIAIGGGGYIVAGNSYIRESRPLNPGETTSNGASCGTNNQECWRLTCDNGGTDVACNSEVVQCLRIS